MDHLTAILAFLVTLSLATERITELIKGLPILSRWFAVEKTPGSTAEEFRKATVQMLAVVVGTLFSYSVSGVIGTVLLNEAVKPDASGAGNHVAFWQCVLFGALASGGSGFWNSLLDITREVKRQKEVVTQQTRALVFGKGHTA